MGGTARGESGADAESRHEGSGSELDHDLRTLEAEGDDDGPPVTGATEAVRRAGRPLSGCHRRTPAEK
jgi:hypothetical protein